MTEILLLLAVLGGSIAPARCSIAFLIANRSPAVTYVLARALPDTVAAPGHNIPLPDSVARSYVPRAQRFETVQARGDDVGLMPGDTFRVVPWEYGADCALSPWTASVRWVPPGAEVLFALRRTRHVVRGEATFDVRGWHFPYPQGEFWRHEGSVDKPTDRSRWLSAREYFELIVRLPVDPWDRSDRAEVQADVEAVFADQERWRTTFPGNEILDRYRRWHRR